MLAANRPNWQVPLTAASGQDSAGMLAEAQSG